MKLERNVVPVVAAALGVLGVLAGCASSPPAKTSTTTVTSAPTSVPATSSDEAAPRVGKPQLSGGSDADAEAAKDEPRRDDGRRGGFSGWK